MRLKSGLDTPSLSLRATIRQAPCALQAHIGTADTATTLSSCTDSANVPAVRAVSPISDKFGAHLSKGKVSTRQHSACFDEADSASDFAVRLTLMLTLGLTF